MVPTSPFSRRPFAPVLAELLAVAGDDVELLGDVAGRVSGWCESPETMPFCATHVAEIEGAGAWGAGVPRTALQGHTRRPAA